MRRRLWLGAASLVYMGWRRLRTLGGRRANSSTNIAA
jgi:threonine/homoserine/homoserine lactone efflux protein